MDVVQGPLRTKCEKARRIHDIKGKINFNVDAKSHANQSPIMFMIQVATQNIFFAALTNTPRWGVRHDKFYSSTWLIKRRTSN